MKRVLPIGLILLAASIQAVHPEAELVLRDGTIIRGADLRREGELYVVELEEGERLSLPGALVEEVRLSGKGGGERPEPRERGGAARRRFLRARKSAARTAPSRAAGPGRDAGQAAPSLRADPDPRLARPVPQEHRRFRLDPEERLGGEPVRERLPSVHVGQVASRPGVEAALGL